MNDKPATPNTRRVQELRNRMANVAHGSHRVEMPSEWHTSTMQVSMPERRAYALARILENMPVAIDPQELIVGTRTAFGIQAGVSKSGAHTPNWTFNCFPETLTQDEKERPHRGPRLSHNVGGYGKILELGFGGILAQAQDRLASEADSRKRDFLKGVCISFQAASVLANRYADNAEAVSKACEEERQPELNRIAAVCRHIATGKPRDLHEALQLCWFAHLILMIENYGLMSMGRFDQYIKPFWNTCPPEKAQELLACFFIKMNDQTDIWVGEGATTNNVMLSGILPNGTDGTNDVTYACLDALDNLRMVEPMFAVRLHRESPGKLVKRACDLNVSGLGQIAFYNDGTFIPALARGGIPIESARDYALDACQDILIDGCSNLYIPSSYTYHSLTDLCLTTVKASSDVTTFDELLQACKESFVERNERFRKEHAEQLAISIRVPMPFTSGTLRDCVETGRDLGDGGARFSDMGVYINSPVNAINSLAAIKKVVFDDKLSTMPEVIRALETNYEAAEPLRQRLHNAPKWGNDDDYVDLIAKDFLEFCCNEVQSHKKDKTSHYLSGIHEAHHVSDGSRYGATPDGRLAGKPFPVTLSPANGTDQHGPTAIIRSMTKLDPMIFQWNCALGISLHPSGLQTEAGKEKFAALVKSYIVMGGPQLQCSIVDADTLRAAQKNPEDYASLVVRVWGFSARFVDLSTPYQDEFIERTLHAVA